ncbi:hypothetical protein V6N13_129579 [Hibiscus sabdariffa]
MSLDLFLVGLGGPPKWETEKLGLNGLCSVADHGNGFVIVERRKMGLVGRTERWWIRNNRQPEPPHHLGQKQQRTLSWVLFVCLFRFVYYYADKEEDSSKKGKNTLYLVGKLAEAREQSLSEFHNPQLLQVKKKCNR